MGKDKVKKAFDNGDLSRSFLTNMEAAHLTKVANDIESYLMWGQGGRVRQDGPDDLRLSVGLWKQLITLSKEYTTRITSTLTYSVLRFITSLMVKLNSKVQIQRDNLLFKLVWVE